MAASLVPHASRKQQFSKLVSTAFTLRYTPDSLLQRFWLGARALGSHKHYPRLEVVIMREYIVYSRLCNLCPSFSYIVLPTYFPASLTVPKRGRVPNYCHLSTPLPCHITCRLDGLPPYPNVSDWSKGNRHLDPRTEAFCVPQSDRT
jgi:hypothetical protein